MKEENTTPLRQRMIEDMRIRGMGAKTQQGHIRAVRYFAEFIGRSSDIATPDELRAYQLHMTDTGVSTGTFNARIVSLRFFFGVTCGREEMKRYMQFRRKPKKLPVVLSVEEVGDLLAAVPGPGLKYRAALGISYGAGLRASEVCNLKVSDIDSDRMLIHVDEGKNDKDRKAMLSPGLLDLLRDYWLEARPEGWLFPIADRRMHAFADITLQSGWLFRRQDSLLTFLNSQPSVSVAAHSLFGFFTSDSAICSSGNHGLCAAMRPCNTFIVSNGSRMSGKHPAGWSVLRPPQTAFSHTPGKNLITRYAETSH